MCRKKGKNKFLIFSSNFSSKHLFLIYFLPHIFRKIFVPDAGKSGQSNAPPPVSAEASGALGEVVEVIGGQLRSLMVMLGGFLSPSEAANGSQLSMLWLVYH